MRNFEDWLRAAIAQLFEEESLRRSRAEGGYMADQKDGSQLVYWPKERAQEDLFLFVHDRSMTRGLHKHDYFIFNYVYSGAMTANIDGKVSRLEKGAICILQPGVAHHLAGCADAQEPTLMVSIAAKTDFMRRSFMSLLADNPVFLEFFIHCMDEQKGLRVIEFYEGQRQMIHKMMGSMIVEAAERKAAYIKMMESYFAIILIRISRSHRLTGEAEESERHISAKPILQYIGKNFATTTLAKTAEAFNYNPSYLSSVLRRETGQSYSAIVKEMRMQRASRLLMQTDLPVSTIASMVGYTHLGGFHKAFKESFGQTPNALRKTANHEKESCR